MTTFPEGDVTLFAPGTTIGAASFVSGGITFSLGSTPGNCTVTSGHLATIAGVTSQVAVTTYMGNHHSSLGIVSRSSSFQLEPDSTSEAPIFTSTSTAYDEFDQKFPESTLSNIEREIAVIAFSFAQHGYRPYLILCSSYTTLVNFFEENQWNYEMVPTSDGCGCYS